MSDETADRRKQRATRLSELQARLNLLHGDDPAYDPASAEFERTGRLPPQLEKPEEIITISLRSRILGTLTAFLPLSYPKAPEGLSPHDEWKHYVRLRWRDVKVFAAMFVLSGWLLAILSVREWPWWSTIILWMVVLWGLVGAVTTMTDTILRVDIRERFQRSDWTWVFNAVKFGAFWFATFAITLQGCLYVWGTVFEWGHQRWPEFLWRLSFAIEGAILYSFAFIFLVSVDKERKFSWKQNAWLGMVGFSIVALAFPLAFNAEARFIDYGPGPHNATISGFYIILAVVIAWSCRAIYARVISDAPIDLSIFTNLKLPKIQRTRSEEKPQAPPPVSQPQQINVEFRQKRQWNFPLPSIPGFFSPQAWAGRFMAIMFLAYTEVQTITGWNLIQNNEWRGLPTDDRAGAFYLVGAVMAASFFLFLRARQRIDAHDLRNLRLIAMALLQAVIGFALMMRYQSFGLPHEAELVGTYLTITGFTRAILLLRNPVPKHGWRRFI